jgi:UDPglucose 6-dehydrogenase
MKPDRIVIGSNSNKAIAMMQQLYAPFNRNHDKLIIMDPRSAEMTKYVANAMLATKISFMNEMSQISRRLGADIEQVRRGIGADQRIGYHFIYPGCGYGGSCFPKDVKALRHMAAEQQYQPRMLNAVCNVNVDQKEVLFQKIFDFFQGDLKDKTIAIWGVAFKPKTDDIREASSRVLIELLWQAGARVRLYDPEALDNFKSVYGEREGYVCCDSMTEALAGSDVLAICTEWQCFRSPRKNQTI